MGEVTSFASNKHAFESVLISLGRTKPVSFGHMISRGQEAHP